MIPSGYTGRMLVVHLTSGRIDAESLPDHLLRDFLGGYGLGAGLLLERMPARVDPLGPDNYLGFFAGPLTGTSAPFGNRCMVVAKSPLTGTWGDSNFGGEFGPYLKFAGYDGVLFPGAGIKPQYLLIDHGKASLHDASALWGKDTAEAQLALKALYGGRARVACIGPSGETLSLISCIVSEGRAAGRSGLGAVMGSKRLKAIVVRGEPGLAVAQPDRVVELSRDYLNSLTSAAESFRMYGTAGGTAYSIRVGDAPVKNWGGTALDFPDGEAIGGKAILALEARKHGCWRCPIRCGGFMKPGSGAYEWAAGVRKPEYETVVAFGPACLNRDLPSIVKCNDICNRYGLDTISAGATVAYAIECYENSIVDQTETDDLDLRWGDHKAIVDLTLKMARREGFGAVLADGVRLAAERIGRGAERFAMHSHGQEVPMHDPRRSIGYGLLYATDATPARHTQGQEGWVPPGAPMPAFDRSRQTGRSAAHRVARLLTHGINAAGGCLFGYNCMPAGALPELLTAVTGRKYDLDTLLAAGERIACARQIFNVREGVGAAFSLPARITGNPPQADGPLKGRSIDIQAMAAEFHHAMGWDPTGRPSPERLRELGLDGFSRP